jgi:hypothetical protein
MGDNAITPFLIVLFSFWDALIVIHRLCHFIPFDTIFYRYSAPVLYQSVEEDVSMLASGLRFCALSARPLGCICSNGTARASENNVILGG